MVLVLSYSPLQKKPSISLERTLKIALPLALIEVSSGFEQLLARLMVAARQLEASYGANSSNLRNPL